ncbi:Uncharacterised protein [Leclercia adecarboxylata]|uniref:NAD-dependent epimerase/dehydratase domain-containing protein n=1 Tax=Leclercia adecarboxylata TaxID=83655 RepID=A0A4U9HR71_9ENTR|nr:Uncharacterised protein [Leclercia adecarboxylata]
MIDLLAQSNPHTRFTILRPRACLAPHDKVFIPRLAQMMHHYGSVLLPRGGDALVDMTYFDNAIHAMWLASQSECDQLPSGRAYNITNGEPRSLRSIVQKLIDELNIHWPDPLGALTRCWILLPAAWERLGTRLPKSLR